VSVNVTTYHLEMLSPAELRPKRLDRAGLALGLVPRPMPELNRFFYTAIGGDWYWTDRLPWTYERWLEFLDRPEVQTWVLAADGVPAGYFELEKQPGENVEIAYFGLLPQFVGQGLGGHALTVCIERAWAMAARRVWVHTCTLDHPSALANYQARGMRLFKEETEAKDLPPRSPGPWPGARP
jgi:GNAT superfamily N-acetyltransferase